MRRDSIPPYPHPSQSWIHGPSGVMGIAAPSHHKSGAECATKRTHGAADRIEILGKPELALLRPSPRMRIRATAHGHWPSFPWLLSNHCGRSTTSPTIATFPTICTSYAVIARNTTPKSTIPNNVLIDSLPKTVVGRSPTAHHTNDINQIFLGTVATLPGFPPGLGWPGSINPAPLLQCRFFLQRLIIG